MLAQSDSNTDNKLSQFFSELHLCLFCVEKKGWSDTFATGSSYNEHYWNVHQGIIQKKEKKRNEEKDKKKGAVQVCSTFKFLRAFRL